MKKTFLSLLLAVIVLVSVAYAADGDTVRINKTATPTLFFSAVNKDTFLSASELVTTTGKIYVTNKVKSIVNVKLGSAQLSHVSGNGDKINLTLTSPSSPFIMNINDTNIPLIFKTVSIENVEAGEYTGTVILVNSSNNVPFDRIDARVILPALEITDITVKDKESDITDTKLEKGQIFTVTVDYKNLAEESRLEDVNVEVTVFDGNKEPSQLVTASPITNIDGDDLQDDKDGSDLRPDGSGSVTLEFEMPFAISDGDEFTVLAEVTAGAEDTSSTFYTVDTKKIEASVTDDKIEITKASLTPSTLACGVNKAKMTVQLRNIGDNSEDVQLFLRNAATGFEKQLNNKEDVELGDEFDNEDDFTQTVEEYVTLSDLKAGDNTYTVAAYYSDFDTPITKDVAIVSQSCTTDTTTTTGTTTGTGSQPIVVVTPTSGTTPVNNLPIQGTQPISNPSYVTLKDVSGIGFDSELVLPIAIGVGGLIVGVIVAFLLIPRP